jgi:enoyl-CoA hydratase/carnithine racemase
MTVTPTDQMRIGVRDHVLEIVFNRPEKKNALTNAMYGAWADALEMAERDPGIRVVLHTGEGDVFTAGNDLADFAAVASGTAVGERHVGRVLKNLAGAKKPLIAAVNGLAVGLGTTMLLHCDLVFLSETARLSTPFVNLALVPEAASSLLLPQLIGAKRAYQMFALGEPVGAADAAAWGLANKVVPAGELMATARAAAQALVNRPPQALAITKSLMRDAAALSAMMDRENAHFDGQLRTDEAREAFAAFAERRPPRFGP